MQNELDENDKFYIARVAHFVKTKRKNLKWTQQKMADFFNVDANVIWHMESGKSTTKLSTAIKVIDEFSQKSGMSPGNFIGYLLKKPNTEESAHLGENEIALLKSFRAVPADLRREYAQIAQNSTMKFSLALEILKYPLPIIKKILELLKVTTAK